MKCSIKVGRPPSAPNKSDLISFIITMMWRGLSSGPRPPFLAHLNSCTLGASPPYPTTPPPPPRDIASRVRQVPIRGVDPGGCGAHVGQMWAPLKSKLSFSGGGAGELTLGGGVRGQSAPQEKLSSDFRGVLTSQPPGISTSGANAPTSSVGPPEDLLDTYV